VDIDFVWQFSCLGLVYTNELVPATLFLDFFRSVRKSRLQFAHRKHVPNFWTAGLPTRTTVFEDPFAASQTPRRFSEFLRELEQRREQAEAERQALYKGSPEEEDLEPDALPKPQRTVRLECWEPVVLNRERLFQ
jgi:hypothetical protein